jgi:hypothetical protein
VEGSATIESAGDLPLILSTHFNVEIKRRTISLTGFGRRSPNLLKT